MPDFLFFLQLYLDQFGLFPISSFFENQIWAIKSCMCDDLLMIRNQTSGKKEVLNTLNIFLSTCSKSRWHVFVTTSFAEHKTEVSCAKCSFRKCTPNQRAVVKGFECLVDLSREITAGTKMDSYISSRRNSRLFERNRRVTRLLVQAVIATVAEQAKKITPLTETKTSQIENPRKRILSVPPTLFDWEPISVKWSTEKTLRNGDGNEKKKKDDAVGAILLY